MNDSSNFYDLVVTVGGGRDSRFRVGRQAVVIGRGDGADFDIADMRVSREHAQAIATSSGVEFIVLPTARRPLVHEDKRVDRALVPVGGEIRIGDTVLRVERASGGGALPPSMTLLTGEADDIRASAALYDLSDALRRAYDRPAVDRAIQSWSSSQHTRARHGALVSRVADDVNEPDDHLSVAQDGASGSRVVIALPGIASAQVVLTFDIAPHRIAPSLQRLLLVSGMVIAARLTALDALARAKEDRNFFRVRAFGNSSEFVGTSIAARRLEERIARLAAADVTAFIHGETGTGKTFIARLLHERSERRDAPFRAVNCAAIPETLLESELFGVERGAFTGATATREGVFEAAADGTLFLDEIGELSSLAQAKLLRVLEDRKFERVGSTKTREVKARVITATNQDLQSLVRAKRFREDLYYRICTHTVAVPPLRERPDDIPILAARFLADLAPLHGRPVEGFTRDALQAMVSHRWPGNVRELRNAVEYALINRDGPWIAAHALPETFGAGEIEPTAPVQGASVRLPANQAWLETQNFDAALTVAKGNITQAAALLGMNRVSVHKRLRRNGQSPPKG